MIYIFFKIDIITLPCIVNITAKLFNVCGNLELICNAD